MFSLPLAEGASNELCHSICLGFVHSSVYSHKIGLLVSAFLCGVHDENIDTHFQLVTHLRQMSWLFCFFIKGCVIIGYLSDHFDYSKRVCAILSFSSIKYVQCCHKVGWLCNLSVPFLTRWRVHLSIISDYFQFCLNECARLYFP